MAKRRCYGYKINPDGELEINPNEAKSVTPRSKVKLVSKMLKAIHAQESKKAAREKAKAIVEEFRAMKLKEAALGDASIVSWLHSGQSLQTFCA